MHAYIQHAKAAMGFNDSTVDELYERNKNQMKHVHEVVRQSKAATKSAIAAVTEASRCLCRLNRCLAQFTAYEPAHQDEGLVHVTDGLTKIATDIEFHMLPAWEGDILNECIHRLTSFEEAIENSDRLLEERKRALRTYDYFRNDLSVKESELDKKNKPFAESKSHALKRQKMMETKSRFEHVDMEAKEAMGMCIIRKDIVVAGVLQNYLEHTASFFGGVHHAMLDLFKQAEPIVVAHRSLDMGHEAIRCIPSEDHTQEPLAKHSPTNSSNSDKDAAPQRRKGEPVTAAPSAANASGDAEDAATAGASAAAAAE